MRYKIFEQSSQRKSEMRIFSRSAISLVEEISGCVYQFGLRFHLARTLSPMKNTGFAGVAGALKKNARLRDAQSPQLAFFTDHFEHSECGRQEWPGAQGEFLASLFPSINYIIT